MIRIGYFGYRQWAFTILDRLSKQLDPAKSTIVTIGTVKYDQEIIDYTKYRNLFFLEPTKKQDFIRFVQDARLTVALFYGWSWIVPKALTDHLDCLCLHPSLLPRYRGGTPFQHQILNNEQEGGLTIFRMNDILDGGDILAQKSFSLAGTLKDILDRVVEEGVSATLDIINAYEQGTVKYVPQTNLDEFPAYPRRKPEQSEVKFEQLSTLTCNDFYNFVRALDDPFPNCFITLSDHTILLLQEVRKIDNDLPGQVFFDGTPDTLSRTGSTYIKLKDGIIDVIRCRIRS